MAGDLEFITAVLSVLRTDVGLGGLVELSGHDPTNPDRGVHIGTALPDLRERYPYIGLEVYSDRLFFDGSVPQCKKSRLIFKISSCGDTAQYDIVRIGDRLEGIFGGEVGPDAPAEVPNNYFLDFSNEYLTVKSTGFFSRSKIFEQDDSDIRWQNIRFDVIWCRVPCGT